jgi:uncharacterized protein (TIGR03086 family)
MLTIAQLQTMHGQALEDCGTLLGQVVDLNLPTPCAGWDLSALSAHMIGQNDGFAAAVRDGDADLGSFAPVGVDLTTLVEIWFDSAAQLRTAFAAADPEAEINLAIVNARVSVETALRMHVLDSAVHAWDVAASIGVDYRPGDDMAVFVRDYARSFVRPSGTPGIFAPPLPDEADDAWRDGLRLVGRDPSGAGLQHP